jgi:hypothetical protein
MNATKRRWQQLSLCPAHAFAQAVNGEPVAVVELGAAPSRNLKDHTSGFGPTVAVEVTLSEKWLELEAGVTPSFRRADRQNGLLTFC